MSVPTLKVRSIESYELRQEQRGLILAAHPMTTQEIDDVFTINLLDKGILPILLLAENRSASTSFILDRRLIETGAGNALGLTPRQQKDIGSSPAGEAMIMSGTLLISYPLMFVGLKMTSDATVVAHGLADKEFYSRTLDPGQQASGVIYLRLAEGPAGQGPHVLKLSPIDVETSEAMTFTFLITVRH